MVRKKQFKVSSANFICRFGDSKVLLDLLEEVVIPAFTTTRYTRRSTDTTHFFHNVQLVTFRRDNIPIPCIIGRYVKDTTLRREQIFSRENDDLIRDPASIISSPSSVFVLILDTHKLLYLPETKQAPGLQAFRTTVINFLELAHTEFINGLKDMNPNLETAELNKVHPRPTLEIIPIASSETLEEFVNKYHILQEIKIELIRPNNNLDNNDLFLDVRSSGESLDSERTTIEYDNKTGLVKSEVIKRLAKVVKSENSQIVLRGKDKLGNTLTVTKEKISIQYMIDSLLSMDVLSIAAKMLEPIQTIFQWRREALSADKEQKLNNLPSEQRNL